MATQQHHSIANMPSTFTSAPARMITAEKATVISQFIVIIRKKQDERILAYAMETARKQNAQLLIAYVYPSGQSTSIQQSNECYTNGMRNKLQRQYSNVKVTSHYGYNVGEALQPFINEKKQSCLLHTHETVSWWSKIWGTTLAQDLSNYFENLTTQGVKI